MLFWLFALPFFCVMAWQLLVSLFTIIDVVASHAIEDARGGRRFFALVGGAFMVLGSLTILACGLVFIFNGSTNTGLWMATGIGLYLFGTLLKRLVRTTIYKGTINFTNAKYDGEIMNGQPHGYGQLIYNNGSWYKGNLIYGKFHGQGEYFKVDSEDKMNGDWNQGEFVG